MTDRAPDPNVFETANAGFAQALYEEYLRDPASVSPEWRRLFESGRVGERPPAGRNGAGQVGDGGADGRSDGRADSQADGAAAVAETGPEHWSFQCSSTRSG